MKHRLLLLAAMMAAGMAFPDDAPAQYQYGGAPTDYHYVREPWRNWDRDGSAVQDAHNHYGRLPARSYDTVGTVTIGVQSWNYPQHGHDYSFELRRDNHYLVEPRRSYDVVETHGRAYNDHHYRRENYYERRY